MKILAKEMTPIELTHEAYCEKIGECRCTMAPVARVRRNPATGDRTIGVNEQKFPPVITLLARKVQDLPDECGDLPNVKSMISSRILRVLR